MKQNQKIHTSLLVASILAISTLLFLSFRTTKLLPFEYVEWVDNPRNELKQSKIINDITFSAQYLPHEYLALRQLKRARISEVDLKNELENWKELQYFKLQIGADGSEREKINKMFSSKVSYYAFDMQKDIQLVDGTDTLNCGLFHHEQSYGISPFQTFLLAFESNGHTDVQNKSILLNEKIWGFGKINLTVNSAAINKIPELITN